MRKKLSVVCTLILALFLFPPCLSAQTKSISGPSDFRVGYTGTLTFENSPSTSYDWTFTDGVPKSIHVDNSSQVTWEAKVIILDNDLANSVVVSATDGILPAPIIKELSVYSFPLIEYKEDIPTIFQPGTHSQTVYGENSIAAYGGRYKNYKWTQEGPGYATPKNGGNIHYTVFSAPTAGAYAGEYTITISDGLPGTDSVNVYVPTRVDPGPLYILENSAPVTYTLSGAPDGTTYTARLRTGPNSTDTDVTGDPDYGTVTTQVGGSVGGVYLLFYTPPADATSFNTFYIHCEPDRTMNVDDYGNLYEPLPYGPMLLRDTRDYAGTLRDVDTNAPIPNALISLSYPKEYRTTVQTDANGQFILAGMVSGNRYYLSADVAGYQPSAFTSIALISGNPANSNILLKPAAAGAYVRGTVFKPDGSAFLADEIVTVGLIHWWDDNGVAQVEVLAESTVGGGNFHLELAALPPNPPSAADTYLLMAYQAGEYTELTLAAGSNFPYDNVNLTLSKSYGGTVIGELGNASRTLKMPPTGGYSMSSKNTVKDLITNEVLNVVDGPSFEVLPAGILLDQLTPPPPGLTTLIGSVDDNQKGSTSYQSFVSIAASMLALNIYDPANPTGDYLYRRPVLVTLPIYLDMAGPGSFEGQSVYVRYAGSSTDLRGCEAGQLTSDNIMALDYLGDGRYGSVTALVPAGSYFGAGYPCYKGSKSSNGEAWPDFERYEFFGCFMDSLFKK